MIHSYKTDSQSGAGNCVCGLPERSRIHIHMYMKGNWPSGLEKCTCGLLPEAECHMATLYEENDNGTIR